MRSRRARGGALAVALCGLLGLGATAVAAGLDGLELKTPPEQVRELLAGADEVRISHNEAGQIQMAAGDYVVAFCDREAWSILRTLAPTSSAWVRAVKLEADLRGPARGMAATVNEDKGVTRMTVDWTADRGSTLSLVMENTELKPPRVYRRLSADAPCRASR